MDVETVRRFFFESKPELTTELVIRFRGYTRTLLRPAEDSYGVYFSDPGSPVPYLWLGIGWGQDMKARWGARLVVDGSFVESFDLNRGGLREACGQVTKNNLQLQLHKGPRRVELAQWEQPGWPATHPDPFLAVKRLWGGYLRTLAKANLPLVAAQFAHATRLYPP